MSLLPDPPKLRPYHLTTATCTAVTRRRVTMATPASHHRFSWTCQRGLPGAEGWQRESWTSLQACDEFPQIKKAWKPAMCWWSLRNRAMAIWLYDAICIWIGLECGQASSTNSSCSAKTGASAKKTNRAHVKQGPLDLARFNNDYFEWIGLSG